MTTLYLAPSVIGFLLLVAHFFRAENHPAMILALFMTGLIFVRRPWAARTVQIGLLLGSVEWVRATISLVIARHDMGEPFLRLAMILGGVFLFTVFSALIFQTRRIRAYFGFAPVPNLRKGGTDGSKA